MATPVNYNITTAWPLSADRHVVYLRANWQDAWTEVEYLFCTKATWGVSPDIGEATLSWRYGKGLRPGETEFADIFRLDRLRYYVKIVYGIGVAADLPTWYGTIEVDGDAIDGTHTDNETGIPSGSQTFVCYGLENLLDMHIVRDSVWASGIGGDVEYHTAQRALEFNRRGLGNRTAGWSGIHGFVFDETTGNAFWSSQDIARYMAITQSPRDFDNSPRIHLTLNNANVIPDWDRPVLVQQNRRLRHLLNSIMPRQRMLGYWLGVDGSNHITINPFTYTGSQIALDTTGEATIAANTRTRRLQFDRDRTAVAALKTSTLDSVDQVIVTGRRRRSCFTLGFGDSTIEKGWSTALETEYNEAASNASDYPADTEIRDRQVRNTLARANDRLQSVFSRFSIPLDWDGKAGDGEGTGTMEPVTPQDANIANVFPIYPPELFILDVLPLLDGYDYSGSTIGDSLTNAFAEGPNKEMGPQFYARLPEDSQRWSNVEHISTLAGFEEDNETERRWKGTVRIVREDPRSFMLDVSGLPQHVIAQTDFTALDEDEDLDLFDWRTFLFTIAIDDDRLCQGVFPPTPTAGIDAIRRLVIDAGDAFKYDYIAPDTVVGVDGTTGELIRSDGGFLNDDRFHLARIARLAFEWYRDSRSSLEFETSWLKDFDEIRPGDYVESIGDALLAGSHQQDINSVVTGMTIETPEALDTSEVGAVRIRYVTQFAQFDALSFIK